MKLWSDNFGEGRFITENQLLNIMGEIGSIKKHNTYEMRGKWYIDVETSHGVYGSKEDAEKGAEDIFKFDILTKVINKLDLDYGFDGKTITINIKK